MIADFIATLTLGQELARRAHWRTKSYAEHKATGAFYEGLGGLIDGLVEAYQGRKDIIAKVPILTADPSEAIDAAMRRQLKWIEANRYKAVPLEDSTLQNIVDEVIAAYLALLYQLKLS